MLTALFMYHPSRPYAGEGGGGGQGGSPPEMFEANFFTLIFYIFK